MEKAIGQLLEEEIKKTLSVIADANTTDTERIRALDTLGKLQVQRAKELDANIKEAQAFDNRMLKEAENDLRKAELEQRAKQNEIDFKMKSAELEQRMKLAELEQNLKLAELKQKAEQAGLDRELKEAELERKDAELKEAKKARWWHTALEILGLTVPLGFSAYWMRRGLQFEEEGKVYSSRTGQWLSQHFRLFGKK